MDIQARIQSLYRIIENTGGNAQYIQFHYNGYAEPGYSDPKSGIIATGNWNDDTVWNEGTRVTTSDYPSRIGNLLEKLGVEIEWEDAWSECSDCGKLVRTEADSYSWQPSYVVGDGELLCSDCVCEDAEAHLKSLEGDEDRCNTIENINPEDYGYVKFNEDSYESGWHPGQTDDPGKIANELRGKGIERFLFQLDENSQFYSKWSVYIHEDEKGKLG